jgi:glycine betaine/choline ABC-type transport system substrate-binding protein
MDQAVMYVITYSFMIEEEKVMAIWNDAYFTSQSMADKKVAELETNKQAWVHYQVIPLVKEVHSYD